MLRARQEPGRGETWVEPKCKFLEHHDRTVVLEEVNNVAMHST